MQGTVVKGFFIGGAVGAAAAAAFAYNRPSEATGSEEETDFSRYKHLNMDGALVANLQEPVAVFKPLDGQLCVSMLNAFDDLARIYFACRTGESRPSLVAEALKAKRAATNHLLALVRKARQRKPMAASDILQDVEALKKNIADYIYNITQEQSLQQGMKF